MARILVVDENVDLLNSISDLLEIEGFDVDCFTSAQEALESVRENLPDLVVMEMTFEEMSGVELLQKMRRISELPIIYLSSKASELDEVLGLRMGADDYITKPFSQRLLIERLRTLLRRVNMAKSSHAGANMASQITCGDLNMDAEHYLTLWKGLEVSLTSTEFLILYELAKQPGYVRSRNHLMYLAYGDEVFVDGRTVDSHIKRIRGKIRRVDPSFSHVETLYGLGYKYRAA